MEQLEAGPVQATGWGATLATALGVQWAVVLGLAGVALIWGADAARSAFWGGAAVALPNAGLALWLTLRRWRTGTLSVVAVFSGELLKLGLTLALLVLVVRLNAEVSWIALIVAVIAALKAQWLALWFTRNY